MVSGCIPKERYVKLISQSIPKTTMIYVRTIIPVINFTLDGKNLTITQSTQTVRFCGAGVFISPNGHVLTVNHLFNEGHILDIEVCTYDFGCDSGTVLFTDSGHDLALVKVDIEQRTPYTKITDPRSLKVGQEVVVIGNPLGLDWSVSKGIISALNRDLNEGYNLIQTDAPINPGNSGGPAFNLRGELVGIVNLSVPNHDGLSFAVETAEIIRFIMKFRGVDKALPHLNKEYFDGYSVELSEHD